MVRGFLSLSKYSAVGWDGGARVERIAHVATSARWTGFASPAALSPVRHSRTVPGSTPDEGLAGGGGRTTAAATQSVEEAEELLKLRKQLIKLEKAVVFNQAEVAHLRRAVADVQEDVAQLRRAVINLREDQQPKRRAVADVQEDVAQLRRAVINLRDDEQPKRRAVADVQEDVAQLRRAVSNRRAQLEKLKETDAESSKGGNLQEQLTAAETKLSDAKDELAAAKDELSIAKDELAVAEAKLAAAEAKLPVAEAKLAAAKDELSAAEAKLPVAEAKLAVAEAKLAAAMDERSMADNAAKVTFASARGKLVVELRELLEQRDRTRSERCKELGEGMQWCVDAFSQVPLRRLLTSPDVSHVVPAISQELGVIKSLLEDEMKTPAFLRGSCPVRDPDTYLDQPLAWVLANRAPFTNAFARAKKHRKPLGVALDALALVHGRVSRPLGPEDAKGVVRGMPTAALTFDMGEFLSSSVLGADHGRLLDKLARAAAKQYHQTLPAKEKYRIYFLTSVPRNSKSAVLQALGVKLQDTYQPFLTTYNSNSGIRDKDWKDPSDIPRFLFARIVASRVADSTQQHNLIDRIAPHVETMNEVRKLLEDIGGLEKAPDTKKKAMYIAVDEFSKVIEKARKAAGTDKTKLEDLVDAYARITNEMDSRTFFLFSGFRVTDEVAFTTSSGRKSVRNYVPVLRSSDRQLASRAASERQLASSTFSQAILLHAVLCLSKPEGVPKRITRVVKDALAYEAVKTSAGAFGQMLEDRITGERSALWQSLANLPLLNREGLLPVFIDALHGMLSPTTGPSMPDRIAGWAGFGVVVPTDRNAANGLGHYVSPLMLWYFLHDNEKQREANDAALAAGEEHHRLWQYVTQHWRLYEKLVGDLYNAPVSPATVHSGAAAAGATTDVVVASGTAATDTNDSTFVPLAATGSGTFSARGLVAEVIVRLDVGARLIAAGYELIMCTGDTENMDAGAPLPGDKADAESQFWSHRVDAFPHAESCDPAKVPTTDDGRDLLARLRDQRHGQVDQALRALEAKWNGGQRPQVALLIAVEGFNRACEFAVVKVKGPVVTTSESGASGEVLALQVELYEVKYILGDNKPALKAKVRDAGEGIRQLREHLQAAKAFDIAPQDVTLHVALLMAKPMPADAEAKLQQQAAEEEVKFKLMDLEPTFGGLLLDGDCVTTDA